MHYFTASLLATASICSIVSAQTIRVGPSLQNADPSSIWVMWETTGISQSVVEFGLTDDLGSTTTGSSILSQNGARIHHVRITGLQPDTVYRYRVGSGDAQSSIHAFRTPAEPQAEKPFRFAALSDTQGGPISDMHTRTINEGVIGWVQQEWGSNLFDELDFVIQPGDLVSTGSNYDQWKSQFFDEGQNLYQHVPLYPVPGNHEQDAHWFFDYFNLPLNGTPGFEEHWWYKDHGNIRLVGLDSNSNYRIQTQLDWLQATLDSAAVNDDIDFVFVQLHHPHISGIWTPGNTAYTGTIVEMLGEWSTETGKPSIHFFGHTHAYERGQSKDHNHMYVNVAAGEGGIDYWDQSDIDYDEFQRVFPEWGFVVMEVEAGDDPKFRLRRINRGNNFISRDNEVMDDITVRRYNASPSTPTTVSPADGTQGVDPDLVRLDASEYSDPDGDIHLASEFQVTKTAGDYSNPVASEWIRFENWYAHPDAQGGESGSFSINTVTDTDVTKVDIPLLDGSTTYYWRVRYRDNSLGWSDWSDESSFTTGEAPMGACCFLTQDCELTREQSCVDRGGQWLGLDSDCEDCPEVLVAFYESFDSVVLGANVDEQVPGDQVWSSVPPAGWDVDRSGVPDGGVTEWRGWNFADPGWWTDAASDQGRSQFTKASGVIAIADPDEWDDAPRDPGTFNTWLESPVIDVSEIEPGTAKVSLSSSWRPEGNQRALILASFDGADPVTLADWQSQSGDNFKPDAIDEAVILDLPFASGTQTVVLSFGLLDAGNNWWWAIDDVRVAGQRGESKVTYLHEDFDNVTLGSSIDEPPASNVWTDTPPLGWLIDDSGVPSIGIAGQGVTEWEGWAFADKSWWTDVAGDQRRSEFTSARNTIAIADPDEWDDLGDPESLGPYNASMTTPPVSIDSARSNSIRVSFLSSWRPEDDQRVTIEVSFDNGPRLPLLEWGSQPGSNFKPDATNELVTLPVPNPGGASDMTLTFSMLDAANDWWWAIDDLRITGTCAAEFAPPSDVLNFFDISAFIAAFTAANPDTDLNGDLAFNFFDVQIFLQAFTTGC